MLLLALALACTDDHMEMAESPCMEEQRAGPLSEGASFSEGGTTVTVVAMSPGTPVVGENTWELEVSGSQGCEVSIEPSMPDHGHGAPVGDVIYLDGESWEVQDLEFTMGGYWEVEVTLACEDAPTVVPMALCVDA